MIKWISSELDNTSCYECDIQGCATPYFYRSYYSNIAENCTNGCFVGFINY